MVDDLSPMIWHPGIMKAGAGDLPVSPENPPDRVNYMLKDGGVKILMVASEDRQPDCF